MGVMPPPREYTPPRLPDGVYAAFAALSLEHRQWAMRYSADEHGDVLYQAVHEREGVMVAAVGFDRFARLLAAAAEEVAQ
ncbi:hypothetical protein FZ103_00365 [Streptomonospora sp. PA3]|uniref:hypothetical protein n=1 Tax=Streptomonospora sp. PA3 TaxID=2607326 RepID=UPI0012DE9F4A|nr:hypothetical protein [Streptomonospora sp. PA3]MUL39647.1 hypothetical protein [Streptomonospora sp. PA3]